MSAQATPTEVVTLDDIQTINAAITALREIENRARLTHHEDESRSFNQGIVCEAAALAANLCFNVLNCTNAYGVRAIPEHLLHNREED